MREYTFYSIISHELVKINPTFYHDHIRELCRNTVTTIPFGERGVELRTLTLELIEICTMEELTSMFTIRETVNYDNTQLSSNINISDRYLAF